ncbi:MAG: NAD-binding protein, partial [Holophagales bacterium]|nr:NAD-binding protein [Holophagales bacterium]
ARIRLCSLRSPARIRWRCRAPRPLSSASCSPPLALANGAGISRTAQVGHRFPAEGLFVDPRRRGAGSLRLPRRQAGRDDDRRGAPHRAVVLVGYGRVGRRIAEALAERRIPYVVAEMSRETVERLREKGVLAVAGDASDPAVLVQAHVVHAAMLVVATPDPVKVRKIVEVARQLNPNVEIVLRTHTEEEADLLRQESAGKVFMGEHELALAMAGHVLARMDHPANG